VTELYKNRIEDFRRFSFFT